MRTEDLDTKSLTLIPLVLAGWCRYLMGIDDEGNAFEQSPDPRLDEVKAHVAGISFGDTDVHDKLQPILSDASIFAVDLYSVSLGEKVEKDVCGIDCRKRCNPQHIKEVCRLK